MDLILALHPGNRFFDKKSSIGKPLWPVETFMGKNTF